MSASAMWVVQANLLRRSREDVAAILRDLKIPFVGVNVNHFSDELAFLFDEPEHQQVIPYGSAALLRHAAKRSYQGLFFDTTRFRVDAWLAHRDDMLNPASVMSVRDAISWSAKLSGSWHVRPVEDLKVFAGVVMEAQELHTWLQKAGPVALSPGLLSQDTLIAIAPACPILAEWRWIIVGGKVCDGSLYRMHGQPRRAHETDRRVIAEAQRFADGWLPHETCVMDIGLTEEGPRVIEFNCFNGSGFYYHDVPRIVRDVTDYVDTASRRASACAFNQQVTQ